MPTFGQLLLLGVRLEARVGLSSREVVDDVFSPPVVQPGPPVCTHHPLFLSRSAHGISPVTVREGEILMWNGAYKMEVVKADSTDGDAEVTWALGATLTPTRPAPAWRLLHAVPEWKRAKESKKGTWTVICPCECEVCIVFYPVFARSSREVCNRALRIRICSFTKFARISHEYLHFSISSHSQEPWHGWLPNPRAAVAAQKQFRPAGHTSAPAQPGTGGHVSFEVPSSSAGAPPADIRPAVPAAPPPARGPDPVVVANPVAGTGATAYPSDLPPITTLSMLRSQPPFAWKLDLPGRKRAREELVAVTWEVEVETQDGAREPPLKMSFPCAITYPNPGGGWKEVERIPGGRAAGAGGGAAGNGSAAGAGPAVGAGPQTQAQAGAEAGGGGSGRGGGGQRRGGEGERRCEVPYGGEPGLESPGREGEGGALSSGRHHAPAAWPKGGGAVLQVGGAGV